MPTTSPSQALFVALMAIALPGATQAQSSAPGKDVVPKAAVETKSVAHKDDETIDYEHFVKDLKRAEGPLTLYQKGKSIYLELPEEKLGKVLLVQAAFGTGLDSMFMHAGMPIGGQAVDALKFGRKDDMVWLERPHVSSRWDANSTFKEGAERTFSDSMLNTFHVEQHNNEKKLLLVNITSFFNGDLFHLGEMVAGGLGGPYQLDPARSEPSGVKGFPDNTVVDMKLHFVSPRGAEPSPLLLLLGGGVNTLEDDRSAPVDVVYSMWWRKESSYVSRIADPRIGYFTTDFFSVDKFLLPDKDQHYLNRFDLQKKEPKAALSDPVKPIVWTIDPSIPEKYRGAVKEGVLRWNKAFEPLGFKNAVQVQDAPKEDKDYNHADGRYNVIRMMVGPAAPFAAISLLRTDPFTGQILNASITLDANVLSSLIQEHARNLPLTLEQGQSRMEQVLLRNPARLMTDDRFLFQTRLDEQLDRAQARMQKFGWSGDLCSFASEMAERSGLGYDALQMAPASTISRDAYVKAYLSEAVCHEIGHCLGLRHNFAGSTMLTTNQLADEAIVSKVGTSASVMDYTPPNAPAILKGKGTIFMNTVGPYDLWAIEYGYGHPGAKSPEEERFTLGQVAAKSGAPGHQYLTDEDADQFNPNAVRFDCSSDPLNFSTKQLQELHRARKFAIDDLPRPGESYSARTKVVMGSILRSFNEGRIAARFVGGTYGTKNFHGDEKERPTLLPVSADTQRQAMKLIVSDFFAPDSFDLPSKVMESLSLDSPSTPMPEWNAPLRQIVGGLEQNLLALVMSASTTDRVAENAYKEHGANAYSLDEHYSLLLHSTCSELLSNQIVSPLRRDLQRFFVHALVLQAGASQGAVGDDVRLVADDSLRRLDAAILAGKDLGSKDNLTRLHARNVHEQIARFLSRNAVEGR